MGIGVNGNGNGLPKQPICGKEGCILCAAVEIANASHKDMVEAVRRLGWAAADAHVAATKPCVPDRQKVDEQLIAAVSMFAARATEFFGDMLVVCGSARGLIRLDRTDGNTKK